MLVLATLLSTCGAGRDRDRGALYFGGMLPSASLAGKATSDDFHQQHDPRKASAARPRESQVARDMASHGVPRLQPATTRSEEARRRELKEIKEYKDLVERVERAVSSLEYTPESLSLTSKLLSKNPEYYTAWNHRRRILAELFLNAASSSKSKYYEDVISLLSADLEFLIPLLINYPKCYWIWNHRLWLLQQATLCLPEEDARKFWQQELGLVGKMLSRDSRNFHGWDYRRRVIAALRKFGAQATNSTTTNGENSLSNDVSSLTEDEFTYTTKMVHSNLSNFSAWHNRSKLIPQMLDEHNSAQEERRKMYDDELALIQTALSTDPYDQSLWFYHQYLISTLRSDCLDPFVSFTNHDRLTYLEDQINFIREILDDTDDCKWIYQHLLLYVHQYLDVDAGNAFVTTTEMRSWLSRLRSLDPLRSGRWNDLEESLGL